MKRTKHNLSNYKLATMDMGKLYPVQLQEVLAGDTMRLSTSSLIRMSPMLAPVMHPLNVRIHHFFVPTRLLWDGWEDFITGGSDGNDAQTVPQYTVHQDDIDNWHESSLDHLGIPPTLGLKINALPIRAYNMIWNEFYRDEDLTPGQVNLDWAKIKNVSWSKDYFTVARPFPQKGADVVLPIGTVAPIKGSFHTITDQGNKNFLTVADSGHEVYTMHENQDASVLHADSSHGDSLYADLQSSTGLTATQFREFFALERYKEARARYGSRYIEYLAYLGVKSSDARLQRPEYLGGGKTTLQISEVLQTAEGQNPVGEMRGHGIGAVRNRPINRYFEEHGYVISMMSIVPKSIYQDGVHRTWLRETKEDYYQKELAHVGQQKIYEAEIYARDPQTAYDTFGYSNRYEDYTYTPSTVAGDFRTVLDHWHLARKWSTKRPVLNQNFVECKPTKRIFAEQTRNPLWCMINNRCSARRSVLKNPKGKLL